MVMLPNITLFFNQCFKTKEFYEFFLDEIEIERSKVVDKRRVDVRAAH